MAVERIYDISGGIQTGSNWLLRASNQLEDAENARFDYEVGGAVRRDGYEQRMTTGTNEEALGFHEAKFDEGPIMFVASDNGTNTVIKAIHPDDSVETVISDLPRHTKCQFIDHLNEVYVAGITTDTEERIQPRNIRLDSGSLVVSTSRNLFGAPKAAYVGENSGKLYLMNVELDKVYPDRAYESSPPMGAITYVKGDQNNTYAPVTLVIQTPVMTSNTAPSGVVASSTVTAGFEAYKAFDRKYNRNSGSNADMWATATGGTTTGWIRYDFGSGNSKVIQYYSIMGVPTNPSTADTTSGPKSWTLEGSNDASSWTVLNTQTNVPNWNTAETRTYVTTNTTAYRYYRVNVSANQGGTSYLCIAEISLYSALQGTTRYRQMPVDSVRYIKPGMELEVYRKGTETKLADITVDSVNNADDTFNFLTSNEVVSAVTAASDTVTVADTTAYPVGTPVVFNSTGTIPGGLTADVTYYSIPVTGTTMRLATSYDLALIGNYIDITSAGTGVLSISKSYVFGDNDEIWLKGRKADLSVLWNTDYRTPQTSDYLRIPSGSTSDTAISGWTKSNNRLNIFTPTSMHQWDNANFVPIFEDIGCISHDTIQNAGQWVIWLDATGKVRARDSTSGQDEIISRFVRNGILDTVPAENLKNASASMFDGTYKLSLGLVGDSYLRMVYGFDSNAWWRETHVRHLKYAAISRISGKDRLYWITDGIEMYLDEEGTLDHDKTIPFMVHYGKRSFGSAFKKALTGFYVFGEALSSAKIFVKPASARDWITIGQLADPVSRIVVGDKKKIEDRYFDIKISQHAEGQAPRVDAIEVHYNQLEETFG